MSDGFSFNPADWVDTPSAEQAYKRQSHERRMSQNFTKYMSNTAYQRQAEDLEKAGLNRIYGLSKGMAGASTPASPASGVQQGRGSTTIDPFQISLMKAQKEGVKSSAKKAEQEAEAIRIDNSIKKIDEELYRKYPILRQIRNVSNDIGAALGAINTGTQAGKGLTEIINNVKKENRQRERDTIQFKRKKELESMKQVPNSERRLKRNYNKTPRG